MIKLISLLLILPLIFCGCVSMQYTNGVPNFRQVDNTVYRGGQPTQQGWDYLIKNVGIQVDLKLNTDREGSDTYAESNGVWVIKSPITLVQQTVGEPDFLQMETDLIILNYCHMHNIKVYVHCSHGQDRTGLIIGSYRDVVCDWPKDKAYAEMAQDGFHPTLRGLYWAWEDYVQ